MLECVLNISEGRDVDTLDAIAAAAGDALLDLHSDPHHNRSVLTLVGDDAPRAVATVAVDRLDIGEHHGAHPRIGIVDVVPFVALDGSNADDALAARDAYARWSATELGVPCYLYGPERTLPALRRAARAGEAPDLPTTTRPRPTAGSSAVGQRGVLVAFNLWLAEPDLHRAHAVAAAIRRPGLRTLGLAVGDRVQVSMNLVDPTRLGPADAYDLVAERADVAGAELVGLAPRAVLNATPRARWVELDLAEDRTIEARLDELRPSRA